MSRPLQIGHDNAVGFHLAGGVLEDGAAVNRRNLLTDALGGSVRRYAGRCTYYRGLRRKVYGDNTTKYAQNRWDLSKVFSI